MPLQLTHPRATLEEVLEFANRVRKAGGGKPLEALMPGIPQDANQCLIAKNLNFDCSVSPRYDRGREIWVMSFIDPAIRDAVAKELDLESYSYSSLILPDPIAAVADAFDSWLEASDAVSSTSMMADNVIEQYQAVLDEFTPFVEAAFRKQEDDPFRAERWSVEPAPVPSVYF